MEELKTDTEKLIVSSATKLFVLKGFKGTTVRDIADEAGVNLAMINYYFRSKDRLLDIVFHKIFGKLFSSNGDVVFGNMPLFEKIRHVVDNYFEVLTENPQIPIFILGELSRDPDLIIGRIRNMKLFGAALARIRRDVEVEIQNGTIKPINPIQLCINIVSLSVFTFMSKPIVDELSSMAGSSFNKIIEERKHSVAQFVIDAIKIG